MVGGSLFAHLAFRFASHPENLATEALCYLLRASAAREALLSVCRDWGAVLPANLQFRPQASGTDDSIPDAAGLDQNGQERLLIEAKFWAGLTDHQPVTYARRLESVTGMLLFLAPAARMTTLWDELRRRCEAADLSFAQLPFREGGIRAARVLGDKVFLGLVDWPTLLGVLGPALVAAKEVQLADDLAQLRGLCERMDTEGFLPFRSEEMATLSPQRLLQLRPLINDLVQLSTREWCNTKGLQSAATAGGFARYMQLNSNSVGVYVAVDWRKWHEVAETPLWLRIAGPGWKPNPTVLSEALRPLEQANPRRAFPDPDYPSQFSVPLFRHLVSSAIVYWMGSSSR